MRKILIALMMMGLSTGAIAGEVSNVELLREIQELKKEVEDLKKPEYSNRSNRKVEYICPKWILALPDYVLVEKIGDYVLPEPAYDLNFEKISLEFTTCYYKR